MRSKPTCHPEKRYAGRGLCHNCYSRVRHRERLDEPGYLEAKRARERRMRNNPDYKASRTGWDYKIPKLEAAKLLSVEKCAICYRVLCGGQASNNSRHIDHCHKSGKIRGVLCSACNRALGLVRDEIETLTSAADYLAVASAQLAYA